MNIRKALVGAMLMVGAAGIAGAAQAERAYIDVQVAPPPDRVEHVPPPRHGYVQWVSHRWVHRGDRWRFEEGHWD